MKQHSASFLATQMTFVLASRLPFLPSNTTTPSQEVNASRPLPTLSFDLYISSQLFPLLWSVIPRTHSSPRTQRTMAQASASAMSVEEKRDGKRKVEAEELTDTRPAPGVRAEPRVDVPSAPAPSAGQEHAPVDDPETSVPEQLSEQEEVTRRFVMQLFAVQDGFTRNLR